MGGMFLRLNLSDGIGARAGVCGCKEFCVRNVCVCVCVCVCTSVKTFAYHKSIKIQF